MKSLNDLLWTDEHLDRMETSVSDYTFTSCSTTMTNCPPVVSMTNCTTPMTDCGGTITMTNCNPTYTGCETSFTAGTCFMIIDCIGISCGGGDGTVQPNSTIYCQAYGMCG